MNRYRTYGQLDDTPEVFGDSGFLKLDMLTDPAMLEPGTLAECENMRFDTNGTTVRGGMARQFPGGATLGTLYGAEVYKPSADQDYMAFATSNYLVLFNTTAQTFNYYTFPTSEIITEDDRVDIVQAGIGAGTLPQLWILRGESKTALKFDANTGAVTVDASFAKGNFALFVQDRIAVGQSQAVPVSDFLSFGVFNTLSQFQILKGGNDFLQCLLPYQKDYVLVGSRQGWFLAFFDPKISTTIGAGYEGGLQDNSFMRVLTREAGPVGNRAAIEAMGLIWFISGGAIYAFQPQLDNQLTVLGKPISADIQPIMERMCVKYAQRACVERYGYRLYFALPISDEPLAVATVTVTPKLTTGLTLPFTLPTVLSTNSVATITTTDLHNVAVGDRVQLSGAPDAGLNGEFAVFSVADNYTFDVRLNIDGSPAAGSRMFMQKLATRNNCIAVYNLNNRGWESLDWLPTGFYADWLRAIEHAAQRRLLMIDAESGPFLYEEGEQDEVGDVTGGINLPFTLPVTLSAVNFSSQPIPGHILSRCYRWGIQPRKVTRAEARCTLDTDSALTLTLMARNPNSRLWTSSRNFTRSQFSVADAPLRKMCGERALEAQVEINTTSGRPTIRSVSVETNLVGKVEE